MNITQEGEEQFKINEKYSVGIYHKMTSNKEMVYTKGEFKSLLIPEEEQFIFNKNQEKKNEH